MLHDAGVETVVLDRYKMPGGEERDYTTALAQAIFAGQAPQYEDDRITVYAVGEPDELMPYLALGAENWGPLVETESGGNARALGDQPAALEFHHLPDDAKLRIRYRTLPGVSANVVSSGTGAVSVEE